MIPTLAMPFYFGKVPSRGDFVRSVAGSALIRDIDDWMSRTMDLLAQDARWKLVYDAAAPIHFAIVSPRSRGALVGHLAVSQDTSGRRFPFVLAAPFDVRDPRAFLPHFPRALAPLWHHFDVRVRQTLASENFGLMQEELVARGLEIEQRPDTLQRPFSAFAQQQSLASLESMLSDTMCPFSFRRAALALGMLLSPVLAKGHKGLDKGLRFPLPTQQQHIPDVVTLWVSMVSRFFARTSAEIAVFVTLRQSRPVLVIGFHGASPATLRSVLDAECCSTDNVSVDAAEWVEDWIGEDVALRRLSNLLRDPALSIATALDMHAKTFIGDRS